MRDAQKPIAAWIVATMKAKGWTAYRWAKETDGKVNPTTIQRATSDSYPGVTSMRIVEELARAANAPNPIAEPEGDLINEALLCEILPVVLATMGYAQPSPEDLVTGARLLQSGIEFAQANREVADDPMRMRFAMRALSGTGAHKAT